MSFSAMRWLMYGLVSVPMVLFSQAALSAQASSEAEIVEAQNAAPAPNRTSANARNSARQWIRDKKFKQGWDPDKNRMIVVGNAGANIGPGEMEDFIDIRNSLYVEAELQAKARIIETFLVEASAENILSIPGNPIAKQLEKDQKALKDLLKKEEEFAAQAQKEAADILKSVDSARADELEGVTVGDRLNRLLEAAIRKIDESYTEGSIAEDKKQRVEDLKLRWQRAQEFAAQATSKRDAIADQLKAIQGEMRKETRSAIETHSEMPLFGAVTLSQFESYDDLRGGFQLSIVMAWSPKLEQESRSILLTQGNDRKPRPNKKTLDEWLDSRDLSVMVGTRRYLPSDGSINFMGISAVAYDPDDEGMFFEAETEAELWAKQLAILSLTGDMESSKRAERLKRQVIGADGKTKDKMLKDLSVEMRNSVEGVQMRGLEVTRIVETTHPASGKPIVVAVATVNSDIAAKAGDLLADTYATLKEFNEDQSFKAGQIEGMVSTAERSKNDPAARAAGFADGSSAVNQEFISRDAAATRNRANSGQSQAVSNRAPAPAARPTETQSGTWGGDDDIDDDF